MLTSAVQSALGRDLRTLRREVEAYPDERLLWKEMPGVTNPAGTLVLHLTGNIQHFIGARLGGSGYVRDRPAEFSRRDVPRAELLQQITQAEAVLATLRRLGTDDLEADFPEPVGGYCIRTAEVLIHIVAHFTYHLGQIDYHRRMATGQAGDVGALRSAELGTARPVG
jgi:uncharacterized damage-inducible protein DinB